MYLDAGPKIPPSEIMISGSDMLIRPTHAMPHSWIQFSMTSVAISSS